MSTSIGKNHVYFHTIDDTCINQRLDNFLTKILKGVPKTHIYKIIRTGDVKVNSHKQSCDYKLLLGDIVRIPPIKISSKSNVDKHFTKIHIPIIFEDEHLLVIDKPSGIASHGGSGVSFGVIEYLRHIRPQLKFLELAHRLDRGTSGVLVLAKTRMALLNLHDQIKTSKMHKIYQALSVGIIVDNNVTINAPLLKYVDKNNERRVRVSPNGAISKTQIITLKRYPLNHAMFPSCTLVEARLKTGRTHQIRVHLSHLNHPILGDDKYGDFALNKNISSYLPRMFLHAHRLQLNHPVTNQVLNLVANLPTTLIDFLNLLESPV